LRVAVLEFICCSGLFHAPQSADDLDGPASLLQEGYAMLFALASDLHRSGHEVATVLEASIADWIRQRWQGTFPCHATLLPTNEQDPDPDQPAAFLESWYRVAATCEATIVIAPELDGALTEVIGFLRARGIAVIAPCERFLVATSDKLATSEHWSRAGVPHPATWRLDRWIEERVENTWSAHAPNPCDAIQAWVIKRRMGAGGVDLQRCPDASHVHRFAQPLQQSTTNEYDLGNRQAWLVQPWLDGKPASMAVLASGEHRTVLGAMQQHLSMSDDQGISYQGGAGPLEDAPIDRLQTFADQVLAAIPGRALGWIGIDFVVSRSGQWHAIEVNRSEESRGWKYFKDLCIYH
jgi:predicted ATP-grasp superfamily ATP-dependent carboligase